MENKEENTDTISSQTLINDNSINKNEEKTNKNQPLKVVVTDNDSMEINIEQSNSPIIQLNFDKMDLNSVSPSQSPSLNPVLPDEDTNSDIPDSIHNTLNNNTVDSDNDNDDEDYGTSNFILYKKIRSNNNGI